MKKRFFVFVFLVFVLILTSCAKPVQKYKEYTTPVVTYENGKFSWYQITDAAGYVIMLDGEEKGIGNPFVEAPENVFVAGDNSYRMCYYEIDDSQLSLGAHSVKFCAYYLDKDGNEFKSPWTNSFDYIVKNPDKPSLSYNNGSFTIGSSASIVNFKFVNTENKEFEATYYNKENQNRYNVSIEDLEFKTALEDNNIYSVTATVTDKNRTSVASDSVYFAYNLAPNKPTVAVVNNTLTITSEVNNANVTVIDEDNEYTAKVVVGNNGVSTIKLDDIEFNNDFIFEANKIYTLYATVEKNNITSISDTIAFKYIKNEVTKPAVSVTNNELYLISSEIDITFKFGDFKATYTNPNVSNRSKVDIKDLVFEDEFPLVNGNSYVVTASINVDGEEITSNPIVYTYTVDEEQTKIDTPVIYQAENGYFLFTKPLKNPSLTVDIEGQKYVIELTGTVSEFNINTYLATINTEVKKNMLFRLQEYQNAKISIRVNFTTDNQKTSDYSEVANYKYAKSLEDMIKEAFTITYANNVLTIVDNSKNYYFGNTIDHEFLLNTQNIRYSKKIIDDEVKTYTYEIENYLTYGDNQILINALFNNSKTKLFEKYESLYSKVDTIKVNGSIITWNNVKYAEEYIVEVSNGDAKEEFKVTTTSFDTRDYTSSNNFTVQVFCVINGTKSDESSKVELSRAEATISIIDAGTSLQLASSNKYDSVVKIYSNNRLVNTYNFSHNQIESPSVLKSTLFEVAASTNEFEITVYYKGNNNNYVDSIINTYKFKVTNDLSYVIKDGVNIVFDTQKTNLYFSTNNALEEGKTINIGTTKTFNIVDSYIDQCVYSLNKVYIHEMLGSISLNSENYLVKPIVLDLNNVRVTNNITYTNYDVATFNINWTESYLATYEVLIKAPDDTVIDKFEQTTTNFNINNYLINNQYGYYKVFVRIKGYGDLLSSVYKECYYAYYNTSLDINKESVKFTNNADNQYSLLSVDKIDYRDFYLSYILDYDYYNDEYSYKTLRFTKNFESEELNVNIDSSYNKFILFAKYEDHEGVVYRNSLDDVSFAFDVNKLKVIYQYSQANIYYDFENNTFDEKLYLPEVYNNTLTAMDEVVDGFTTTYTSHAFPGNYNNKSFKMINLYEKNEYGTNTGYYYYGNYKFKGYSDVKVNSLIIDVTLDINSYVNNWLALSNDYAFYYDEILFEKIDDLDYTVEKNSVKKLYISDKYFFALLNGADLTSIADDTDIKAYDTNSVKMRIKYNNTELPIPTLKGYDFVGWYDETYSKTEKVNIPTSLLVFNARFKPIEYTLTLNDMVGTAVIKIEVDLNYDENMPVYTFVAKDNDELGYLGLDSANMNPGYVFAGWYLDKECKNEFNWNQTIDKDVRIYAKWIKDDGSYLYSGNKAKIKADETKVFKFIAYETGYYIFNLNGSFQSFYIKDENGVVSTENGNYPLTRGKEYTVEILGYVDSEITTNIKFVELKLKTQIEDKLTYSKDNQVELLIPYNSVMHFSTPLREGYTFNRFERAGELFEFAYAWNILEDVELEAVYEANEYTVTLEDFVLDANATEENTFIYSLGETSTFNVTYDSEYKFTTSREGYTIVHKYNDEEVETSGNWTIAEDTTLVNVYTPNKYNIVLIDTYGYEYQSDATSYVEVTFDSEYKIELQTNNSVVSNGWYTLAGDEFALEGTYTIPSDIELYASYSANITLNDTKFDGNDSYEYSKNTTVNIDVTTYTLNQLPIPTREGYTFVGWYEDEAFNCDAITFIENAKVNKPLYPKYKNNNYTVTFDLNGGYANDPDKKVTFDLNYSTTNRTFDAELTEFNELIYPEIPQRSGYVFAGWYTESECYNLFDFTKKSIDVDTLYAKWITYNGSGILYVGQKSSTIYLYSRNSGTYTYYAFVPLVSGSISISATGTSTSSSTYCYLYNSNKSSLTSGYSISSYYVYAGTLYYVRPCGYSSSFNGTVTITGTTKPTSNVIIGKEMEDMTATYDQLFTCDKPLKQNRIFDYWVDENGDEVDLSKPWSIKQDTTLTAVWRTSAKISYELNGGTNSQNNIDSLSMNSTFNLYDASKEGYTFEGWYLDEDFTTNKVTTIEYPKKDIKLYASWSINYYTLTVATDNQNAGTVAIDGTTYSSLTFAYNQEVTISATAKEDWEFSGWYYGTTFISADNPCTFNMFAEDATVKAVWTYVGDYVFTDNNDGTVTLASVKNKDIVVANIPNEYNGKTVSAIGEEAFKSCQKLTTVTMGNGVTTVGNYVFSNCQMLSDITLSSNLTNISSYMFDTCSQLKEVEIPASVTTIETYSFRYTGLQKLYIPNSVNNVQSCIIGWSNIDGLKIYCEVETKPSKWRSDWNVTNQPVVWGAKSTETKTYNDIVYAISELNGEQYITIVGCDNTVKEIVIPKKIEDIAVTTIANRAFYNKSVLEEVTIPTTVTTMGLNVFTDSNKVTIYCKAEEKPSTWNNSWNCNRPIIWGYNGVKGTLNNFKYTISKINDIDTVLIYGYESEITSLVVPDEIENISNIEICEGSFNSCSTLTTVTLSDSVKKIGEEAFKSCQKLTTVTMGNGVTTVGNYVFSNCQMLSDITLSSNLTNISSYMFDTCSQLKEVEIPASVTTIETYSFRYTGLQKLYIPNSVNNVQSCIIGWSNIDGLKIYCEVETKPSKWRSDWNVTNQPVVWGAKSTETKTYNDIVYAISELNGEQYITIVGCDNTVKEIVIPKKIEDIAVTTIANRAFYNKSVLEEVTIPTTVTTMGLNVFTDSNKVTIYCKAEEKPSTWNNSWNCNRPIIWNYGANGELTTTHTLQYQGTTTTTPSNVQNLTTELGLDDGKFTVTYDKNGASTDMLLRTDSIRMYATTNSTNGNKLTVTVSSNYTINKIVFDSTEYPYYSSTSKILDKNGNEISKNDDGSYTIDGSSFTIYNDNSGVTSNTQVRFQSITIYITKKA